MSAKQSVYEQAITCLCSKQFTAAKKIMSSWSDEYLAAFILHNQHMLVIMHHNSFDSFWKQRLDQIHIPSQPDFHFMEQPGIPNADLVSGYLFYLLELIPSSSIASAIEKKKLFKETDFLSFHIIRLRMHSLFLKMKDPKQGDLLKFTDILDQLQPFARLHGTPGYLLLANGYGQLARSLQKMHAMLESMEAFKICWKYLHVAELAQDDSFEAINNAYFGKGLVLATPFDLLTIQEMKSYCLSFAGSLLPLVNQQGAEEAAEQMYHSILQTHNEKYQTFLLS